MNTTPIKQRNVSTPRPQRRKGSDVKDVGTVTLTPVKSSQSRMSKKNPLLGEVDKCIQGFLSYAPLLIACSFDEHWPQTYVDQPEQMAVYEFCQRLRDLFPEPKEFSVLLNVFTMLKSLPANAIEEHFNPRSDLNLTKASELQNFRRLLLNNSAARTHLQTLAGLHSARLAYEDQSAEEVARDRSLRHVLFRLHLNQDFFVQLFAVKSFNPKFSIDDGGVMFAQWVLSDPERQQRVNRLSADLLLLTEGNSALRQAMLHFVKPQICRPEKKANEAETKQEVAKYFDNIADSEFLRTHLKHHPSRDAICDTLDQLNVFAVQWRLRHAMQNLLEHREFYRQFVFADKLMHGEESSSLAQRGELVAMQKWLASKGDFTQGLLKHFVAKLDDVKPFEEALSSGDNTKFCEQLLANSTLARNFQNTMTHTYVMAANWRKSKILRQHGEFLQEAIADNMVVKDWLQGYPSFQWFGCFLQQQEKLGKDNDATAYQILWQKREAIPELVKSYQHRILKTAPKPNTPSFLGSIRLRVWKFLKGIRSYLPVRHRGIHPVVGTPRERATPEIKKSVKVVAEDKRVRQTPSFSRPHDVGMWRSKIATRANTEVTPEINPRPRSGLSC